MKLSVVLAAKGNRVFTIGSGASVRDAVDILAGNNIGALIVVGSDGVPLGVLSERDIIRELGNRADTLAASVSGVMTTPVVTATPEDDVDGALRTMTTRRFRHMPVVDRGALVGIVTIGDLVKAQLTEFRGALETLETQLMES